MSVCCECFVLSEIGFCDRPIPDPEKSYRMCVVWCVCVCVCVCLCMCVIECDQVQ
jgi:hypothetical protein